MISPLHGEQWLASSRKRQFDIAVSSALLPVTAPVAAIGALAFLAESRVNPIFCQTRLGQHNQPVTIIKLRTMPFAHDFGDGSQGHADARASRIGKLLRKTTIDEMPQIAHILSGKMSIVGPRPLVPSDVANTMDVLTAPERKEWQDARSVAKPGWLSDFGNMSRDISPQSEEYLRARAENDCRYAENASFATDLRIIQDAVAIGAALIRSDVNPRLL